MENMVYMCILIKLITDYTGADPGFLKGGGSRLGLPAKRGGGPRRGSNLGPMLKSLHRGTKGGS